MEGTQLVKGVLDLAVLAVVAREDGYGYDVEVEHPLDQLCALHGTPPLRTSR